MVAWGPRVLMGCVCGSVVLTDRMREGLEQIGRAVATRLPVLVEGPAGVGKTTLVEAYAAASGQADVVVLNVAEQTDAKALVGLYAADEAHPGTFKWVPGLLYRALRSGAWLVLEDAHLAPMEVLSMLQSTVESGRLLVAGTGETVEAAGSFRLFATKQAGSSLFDEVLGGHWHRVPLAAPSAAELETIVGRRHAIGDCAGLVLRIHAQASEMGELRRWPLVRLLFRLCERLERQPELVAAGPAGFSEAARQFVLLEAYDVYGVQLAKMSSRRAVLRMLAGVLYLGEEAACALVFERHPEVAYEADAVTIGRVRLARRPLSSRASGLAATKLSRQVLERLAICVQSSTPVLLVGETGTGKTTLVQELARMTGQAKLSVLNMSQQTEAADLLGGFRPLSARVLAKGLLEAFEAVFRGALLQAKNEAYQGAVVAAFQKQNWPRFAKLVRHVLAALEGRVEAAAGLLERLEAFERQVQFMRSNVLFGYVEGALVEAVREGHWILLDEINLASAETLEVLTGLLGGPAGSLRLAERGDGAPLARHPDFRLFACMNPATDVAKKDLPASVRARLSEQYVDETDVYPEDLRLVIEHACPGAGREAIATLYYGLKAAIAGHELVDGSSQRPLLNLRTLTRALRFARATQGLYGLPRALFEGFCLAFATTLRVDSRERTVALLAAGLGLGALGPLRTPRLAAGQMAVDGYVLPVGSGAVEAADFVLTPSVRRNVAQLARAVMAGGPPVLLEGPTSSGKTSVVAYLAGRTGHRFMRINNHEHTDLQEYVGAYQPDAATGRLVFREGLLVEALRKGYWLVLDELNLAPSDVLEALNRLLDDNRELFVPELNEMVRPHAEFRLFATQNPAGAYGGRKVLSRAFRSRFLELQVDDLPVAEVEQIIAVRCRVAPSHAARISEVYRVLQAKRQAAANVFAGRHALITLRDLFRWALRPHESVEQLAENGFLVLAERSRHADERRLIRETIEGVCRVRLEEAKLYDLERMAAERRWPLDLAAVRALPVTWTKAMQRAFALVYQCYLAGEPVLLVGETGCGKTTVCELLARVLPAGLLTLNCHQNTETADILGCLRPGREPGDGLFAWYDGPLVQAMRQGRLFLLDEVSLADDSVLERLNSVLEPRGTLVLAEHMGGAGYAAQTIEPAPGFAVLATMNPGGDYGKKELSPALRNRFTEIWVPSIGDDDDLRLIIRGHAAGLAGDFDLAGPIVEFLGWWRGLVGRIPFLRRWTVSLRDVLTWTRLATRLAVGPRLAFVHAAVMLFVDPALARCQREDADAAVADYKAACLLRLCELAGVAPDAGFVDPFRAGGRVAASATRWGIAPFLLERRAGAAEPAHTLAAPTTFNCAYRVLRAMQLGTAVLLEGSPGVGKTTLVEAVAAATGHRLTRINLSDQTDLIDLFGTDLPAEGGHPGQFQWCDGPFLRALRAGDWILLDELNLASQSVLEGLNACLDHRGAVFIPELGRTFAVAPGTRIFAAQNPLKQGGGRKGLPQSFVNRFITVWFDQLDTHDHAVILQQAFPALDAAFVGRAIELTRRLCGLAAGGAFGAQGRPWEFNLRDLFRWLRLAGAAPDARRAAEAFRPVFLARLRTAADRAQLVALYEAVFGCRYAGLLAYHLTPGALAVGLAVLPEPVVRGDELLLRSQLAAVESVLLAVAHGWLSILVGPSGAGKSSVVRLAARLHGAPLAEFALGPDTDTLELLGSFEQTAGPGGSARFEWVDGPLTRALEAGHWLVLDNANTCSPAVLDRLNSLFEPGGALALNEASGAEPRVVRPHPAFRLFMTVDPRYGELSRAMRNRGVEVALIERAGCADKSDLVSLAVAEPAAVPGVLAALPATDDLRLLGRALALHVRFGGPVGAEAGAVPWPRRLFEAGELFQFEAQTQLLARCMAPDAAGGLPVVLRYLGWASPLDLEHRLGVVQAVCPGLWERAHGLQARGLPDYGLAVTTLERLDALHAELLGVATPAEAVHAMRPLARLPHVFAPAEAAWWAAWEAQCAPLGYRDEQAYRLLLQARGDAAATAELLRYNGGADVDLGPLEARLAAVEAVEAAAPRSPLAENIVRLAALRDLYRDAGAPPASGSGALQAIDALERFARDYVDLGPLVVDVCRSTRAYMEGVSVAEAAGAGALLAQQRELIGELAELDRTTDRARWLEAATGLAPRGVAELEAEIGGFVRDFVDPVEAHHRPTHELATRLLAVQQAELGFEQAFQDFYYGAREAFDLGPTEGLIGAAARGLKWRPAGLAAVKGLLGQVNLAADRATVLANLRAIYARLRGECVVPSDLAVLPLLLVGQLLCAFVEQAPAREQPLLVAHSGRWMHERLLARAAVPLGTAMVAFEYEQLARALGADVDDRILGLLAERLACEPAGPAASEDITELVCRAAGGLPALNRHVVGRLARPAARLGARDFEELAEAVLRHGRADLVTPVLAMHLMGQYLRPHECAGGFGHVCPAQLAQVLAAVDGLAGRVRGVLARYPEHDLLQNLERQCVRLGATPVREATLFAVSGQLEGLLGRLQTWHSVCGREDACPAEAEAVMEALFVLRRREMESWRGLRGHAEAVHVGEAQARWAWLMRLLLAEFAAPGPLLELLELFLLGAPVGEFAPRLGLLATAAACELVPAANRTLAANCHRYYAQFGGPVARHLDGALEPLAVGLRGFLATVRWNDKNLAGHVESSQRVHVEMMRVYRRMQEAYGLPTSHVLTTLALPAGERAAVSAGPFEEATGLIFERLAELRAPASKDAVQRKQQAVVELFRYLKGLGVQLHKPFDGAAASLARLLAALPELPAAAGDAEYVFRGLVQWSTIQGLLGAPHADNNLRQVEIFKTAVVQLLAATATLHRGYGEVRAAHGANEALRRALAVAGAGRPCVRLAGTAYLRRLLALNLALATERGDAERASVYVRALALVPADEVAVLGCADQQWLLEALAGPAGGGLFGKNQRKLAKRLRALAPCSAGELVAGHPFRVARIVLDGTLGSFRDPQLSISEAAADCGTTAGTLAEMEVAGRSLAKLAYVVSAVFAELLRNGFCRPQEPEEQAGEGAEGAEGVGMAEGQGEKDVSKEIEFEEQVTGLAGEQPEDAGPAADTGEGLEMEQDFEAQLEDLLAPEGPEEGEEAGEPADDRVKDEAGQHDGAGEQDHLEMDLEQEDLQPVSDGDELEKLDAEQPEPAERAERGDAAEEGEAGEADAAEDAEMADADGEAAEAGADAGASAGEASDMEEGTDGESASDVSDADDMADDMSGVSDVEGVADVPDVSDGPDGLDDMADDIEAAGADADDPMDTADEPEQEQEDEQLVAKPRPGEQAGAQDAAAAEPTSQAGAQDGREDAGQVSSLQETAAADAQGPADQAAGRPLEEVLEQLFRSVHAIAAEDREAAAPAPRPEFSRQQQFQHSSDQENQLGVLAPADEQSRMRDRVQTEEQPEAGPEAEGAQPDEAAPEQPEGPAQGVLRADATVERVAPEEPEPAAVPADWEALDAEVAPLAGELCEQLRLVLEPTKAAKMRGDYKTGKRLNLRKLIPYIISQYRKDRIWLRRTKPSKRTYRVALSVDNSRSMRDSGCDRLALKAVALVGQALHRLEAGRLAVVGFGERARVIVPFGDGLLSAAGAALVEALHFSENSTDVVRLMDTVIECFEGSAAPEDYPWNLNILISDGICEDHEALRTRLNEAVAKRIMTIFVVLDAKPAAESITELAKVEYEAVRDEHGLPTGKTAIRMKKYLETFPFENYIVVRDVDELPVVLSEAVRQWFELLSAIDQ